MATSRKRPASAAANRARKSSGRRPPPSTPGIGIPTSPAELIVIAEPQARLRARGGVVTAAFGVDTSGLAAVLESAGATMRPLFGASEERAMVAAAPLAAAGGPDLSTYYLVEASEDQLEKLAAQLRRDPSVHAAYVKPPASPPVMDAAPADPDVAPPTTPDFTANQFYLEVSPGGVDARYGWTRPGGGGQNVRVVDVEGAWRFSHEDLVQSQGGVVGGTQSTDIGWRNHGTAVTGVIGGDRNSIGITGISPDANIEAISIFGNTGSALAIRNAADRLNPGDIILIELHRPGPRSNPPFTNNGVDQVGFIAVEWWDDDFAAIQYATQVRGVIVVEAAGNGAQNLDDAVYSTRPANFPPGWTNPFNRANRDSGAILVGAGAPPPGTHGNNWGADRSRLDFSNWGASIDVQGVGREVTTTGYGDLQGGTNEDVWYTNRFSGTSSSSPIVVGSVASVQGVLRAGGRTPLTPATARAVLRQTGSPQQDEPGRPASQRIGNRPNIRQMLDDLFPQKNLLKETIKEKIEIKEHKELLKERIKDKSEFKERKELIKENKELVKERIKDTKELKEGIKEFKEGVKEFKEFKEVREGPGDRVIIRTLPPDTGSDVGDRVAALEANVAELTHFIVGALRPDLATSALSAEDDYQAAMADSAELQRQATLAQAIKNERDVAF